MLARASRRIVALAAAGVLVACLAGGAAGSSPPKFDGPTLANPAPPPAFSLHDQHGRLVSLERERGKVVLITFLYTHCPDVCPLTAAHLNTALAQLGSASNHVAVLAISVDPKGDTPASVRTFIRVHALRPQFHYLTGSSAELKGVWRAYKVAAVRQGAGDVDHTLYTLVVDRQGSARVLFDSRATPKAIAHDVRLLLA
jgi:protein SCO1